MDWTSPTQDRGRLRRVAASALRTETERIHDLTASVESDVATTATRFVVIYKVNSAFAAADGPDALARASSYLSYRVIHLRVTGTLRSPTVRVEPIRLLTQEAVRFFLLQSNLATTVPVPPLP